MIRRRSPASSSFILAAARLRALQLDPGPRDSGQTGSYQEQETQPASPVAHQATRPDPHTLLTAKAPMGAGVCGRDGIADRWEPCRLAVSAFDSIPPPPLEEARRRCPAWMRVQISLFGGPAGIAADGLPVGTQIVGPYLHDRTVTAFARPWPA
jgi:hypothetical protein